MFNCIPLDFWLETKKKKSVCLVHKEKAFQMVLNKGLRWIPWTLRLFSQLPLCESCVQALERSKEQISGPLEISDLGFASTKRRERVGMPYWNTEPDFHRTGALWLVIAGFPTLWESMHQKVLFQTSPSVTLDGTPVLDKAPSKHTFTHSFRQGNLNTGMFLGSGRKLENPDKNSRRHAKLDTEDNPGPGNAICF